MKGKVGNKENMFQLIIKIISAISYLFYNIAILLYKITVNYPQPKNKKDIFSSVSVVLSTLYIQFCQNF